MIVYDYFYKSFFSKIYSKRSPENLIKTDRFAMGIIQIVEKH